jgi:hypothetical protein
MPSEAVPNETAYYYPEPYWLADHSDWVKSLLLFFDDVAILLPRYMRGREEAADPTLAQPLTDRQLLRVLEPEWFVDADETRKLADLMTALIGAGAFDELDTASEFASLSMSRMGFGANRELAESVYEALAARGLARDSEDGVSIPMHRMVRSMFLGFLAQLARETGARHGLDLHPVTNNERAEQAFTSFLDLKPMPSRGQVVAMDLQVVSADLTDIPLDDVLQFRDEYRDDHRRYMQHLRQFSTGLAGMTDADVQRQLSARRAEIEEEAAGLRRLSAQAWSRPVNVASFALGLVGAGFTVAAAAHGSNPIPEALVTALTGVVPMLGRTDRASVYTYLFRASAMG